MQEWQRDKQRRIELLSAQPSALCFGPIDRSVSQRCYIGRPHVEDVEGEPVVADWRAPVATPFYRATVADAMGLSLRRPFLVQGREIIDIFDENLARPSAVDAGAYVPDPLLAEIGRGRTGEMRDIVATIQAEQDVIIRAPLDELHHRPGRPRDRSDCDRAAQSGVPAVRAPPDPRTPPAANRRPEPHLPSLHLPGAPLPRGGGRAVFDRVASPTADARISTSFGGVILAASDMAAIVSNARERSRRANDGRHVVRGQLVRLAWATHAAKATSDVTQQAVFEFDVRSSSTFKGLRDKTWPAVTAAGALRKLYGNERARRRATAGVLTDDEALSLARPATRRARDQSWSRADLALLDEAEALISGVGNTYGHIVVDEAQDLSAMDLRLIARRSWQGSMTVLGDLAQATAPAAQTDWRQAVSPLGASDARLEELTVGYRVPEPIMAFANRLLPEAAPGLRPPTSVRQRGEAPKVATVHRDRLGSEVAAEVSTLSGRWSLTGVVVPGSLQDEVAAALKKAAVVFVDGVTAAALGEHVTLLPPSATKGLGFDAVVVVEPALIVSEGAGDLRLLYVVLTRAVQRLTVLRAGPLPVALAG